ncbi:DUF5025 domain-containing protein [Sphingobacterium chuzhouense]|uniref:DUF5025 domain-containing protein n=1 Tax=Sphingobacterium chuzhouense TaxID=1742264 RepID=A0ABR7XRU5_9SPHI|nr:DUF5025 domain-containing protein [Sphingobacterium chuzhouense]MBD1421007.1 DUF5025 domain-containing protein [Sphingobacterium chuzhouense]
MKAKILFLLLAVNLLFGCKKEGAPIEKDDTFFDGKIGSTLYDSIPNEFRTQKLIRTIQENPLYCIILSDTFDELPNVLGLSSVQMQINISNPMVGKKYTITDLIKSGDIEHQGIVCDYIERVAVNPTKTQKLTYIPSLKNPVHLSVNRVDMEPVTKSKIVEGEINGYLFNTNDLNDSIQVEATFRTKQYKN